MRSLSSSFPLARDKKREKKSLHRLFSFVFTQVFHCCYVLSYKKKRNTTILSDHFLRLRHEKSNVIPVELLWKIEHRTIRLDKVINELFRNRIHHHERNDVYVPFLICGLSSKLRISFSMFITSFLSFYSSYLSSYIDDVNSTCLQSETFSPVHTPYSNTRWSLKLYPRGLNEKQQTNNNIAIFLKYVSGTMPMIKAKAEFSVVNRNNELVMLRSTNFHTFTSGNDWGYSGKERYEMIF